MLDFQNFSQDLELPTALDFDPVFEASRQDRHKFVIDGNTGKVLGHVGDTFSCASHRSFFEGVWQQVTENMDPADTEGAQLRFQSGRNGAFGMMDIQFPSIATQIETDEHQTTIKQRIIALHSIDGGSGSNTTLFGAIDAFCLNGMVSGEHSKVRRRNSSQFSMEGFIKQLRTAKNDFYADSARLKVFAQTSLTDDTVKALLNSMMAPKPNPDSKRQVENKADKMFSLYKSEAAVRGKNKFALLSAWTNYATYADDRNGFALRQTDAANQNRAANMMQRELEVNKWISDNRFLEAA